MRIQRFDNGFNLRIQQVLITTVYWRHILQQFQNLFHEMYVKICQICSETPPKKSIDSQGGFFLQLLFGNRNL